MKYIQVENKIMEKLPILDVFSNIFPKIRFFLDFIERRKHISFYTFYRKKMSRRHLEDKQQIKKEKQFFNHPLSCSLSNYLKNYHVFTNVFLFFCAEFENNYIYI